MRNYDVTSQLASDRSERIRDKARQVQIQKDEKITRSREQEASAQRQQAAAQELLARGGVGRGGGVPPASASRRASWEDGGPSAGVRFDARDFERPAEDRYTRVCCVSCVCVCETVYHTVISNSAYLC